MITEVWKDIFGFEGYYQVSRFGNVRSLDRYANHNYGGKYKVSGRLLTPSKDTNGYPIVSLCKNNRKRTITIHRLVAESFIIRPNGFTCVNHLDGNKANNRIDNLEWCDYSINNKHSYSSGLRKAGGEHHNSVKLLDSISGKEYYTIQEASDSLGISYHTLYSGIKRNLKKYNRFTPIPAKSSTTSVAVTLH